MGDNSVVIKKEMQGLLQRQQGGMFNRWKAFQYECRGGKLREFPPGHNPDAIKPRETIDLGGSYVEDGDAVTGKPNSFILITKTETLYFIAPSEIDKTKWMQTLGGRMSMRRAVRSAYEPLTSTSTSPTSLHPPPLHTSKEGGTLREGAKESSKEVIKEREGSKDTKEKEKDKEREKDKEKEKEKEKDKDKESMAASGASVTVIPHSSTSPLASSSSSLAPPNGLKSSSSSSLGDSWQIVPNATIKSPKFTRPLSGISISLQNSASFFISNAPPSDFNSGQNLSQTLRGTIADQSNPEIGVRVEFNNSVVIPAERYYVLESIRFSLLEGKNFKGKKKNNYYVNIYIDSIHKGRSSIQWGTATPFWSENFLFEDVGDARSVNLSVCNVGSKENKTDTLIVGEADVSLKTIGKGVTWVTLKAKVDKAGDAPAISVEATKQRLKILPLKEYTQFQKCVLDDDLSAPKLLAISIGSGAKVEEVARRLLNVFLLNDKVLHLATHLVKDEIRKTDNPAIMFRGNSLATKVTDLFMKEFGDQYLKGVLKGPIEAIYNEKYSCEIDPTRLEKIVDLQGNRERLIEHVKNCWNAIRFSAKDMPTELKVVFRAIRDEVIAHFPKQQDSLRYISVNGFAFLRFFCPAILNPYLFGLMDDHPDEMSKRTLTLVAKTLQNLANLVEFGEKENYMIFLNAFLIDNKSLLRMFVETTCDFPELPTPSIPTNRYLNKELAYLFNFFQEYREKIREFEEGHPDQKLKDFLRIFMKLEFTYSLYDKD